MKLTVKNENVEELEWYEKQIYAHWNNVSLSHQDPLGLRFGALHVTEVQPQAKHHFSSYLSSFILPWLKYYDRYQ